MTMSYGYYGGAIGDMLNQWAQMGFFSYLLPFLLIFAMVFGILSSIKMFKENRAIDAIIALAVGLMALQFDLVPVFFSQVFPRMGVALSVILVIMILAGLFIDPTKAGIMYTFLGVGVIAAIIVLVSSAGYTGYGGYWMYNNWGTIIGVIIFLAAIGIIVGAANKKQSSYAPFLIKDYSSSKP